MMSGAETVEKNALSKTIESEDIKTIGLSKDNHCSRALQTPVHVDPKDRGLYNGPTTATKIRGTIIVARGVSYEYHQVS